MSPATDLAIYLSFFLSGVWAGLTIGSFTLWVRNRKLRQILGRNL